MLEESLEQCGHRKSAGRQGGIEIIPVVSQGDEAWTGRMGKVQGKEEDNRCVPAVVYSFEFCGSF